MAASVFVPITAEGVDLDPDDRDRLAADYVLGSLDHAGRARAELLIAEDPAFAEAVRIWAERLNPAVEGVPHIEPPPPVWRSVEGAGRPSVARAPAIDVDPRPIGAPEGEPHVDPLARLADAAGNNTAVDLARGVARWRAIAATAIAIAAGLVAVVIVERLPVPAERVAGRFVAALSADGATPAMIVDVDTAGGLVTVRPVAVERPTQGSLELWARPEAGEPVSLGLVDPRDPVLRIRPDRAGVIPARGSFAITVEPTGGSPTGTPTGPVVYSGAMIPLAE